MLIFTIPMLVFLLIYNIYTMRAVDQNIARSAVESLSVYRQITEGGLRDTETLMATIAANDTDFLEFAYADSDLQKHISSHLLNEKLKSIVQINATVAAFFIYDRDSDIYREIYNFAFPYEYKYQAMARVKALLSEGALEAASGWKHDRVGQHTVLLRAFEKDGAFIACMFDLEKNQNTATVNRGDHGLLFFTDAQGDPLSHEALLADRGIDIAPAGAIPYSITGGAQRYLAVSEYLDDLGLNFVYAVPYSGLLRHLDATQLFFIISSVVIVLSMMVSYRLLIAKYFRPLGGLIETMDQIKQGKLDTQMATDSDIREFTVFTNTFNEMLDQIKLLKIASYEQVVENQQVKLQYLHIQIRPHFFLNCLKNIYGLAQNEKYHQIQDLTLALSTHLRYIFKDNFLLVPLAKEVQCVRNYILLQQLSASIQISCTIDIDPELEDLDIPPLSILTFVENSIKHMALASGHMQLFIRAALISDGSSRFASIKVMDNGKGFPEDLLPRLNSKTGFAYREDQIGIENVKHRFSLIYHDKASFLFTNITKGACVEFFVPLDGEEVAS